MLKQLGLMAPLLLVAVPAKSYTQSVWIFQPPEEFRKFCVLLNDQGSDRLWLFYDPVNPHLISLFAAVEEGTMYRDAPDRYFKIDGVAIRDHITPLIESSEIDGSLILMQRYHFDTDALSLVSWIFRAESISVNSSEFPWDIARWRLNGHSATFARFIECIARD